MSNSKAGNAISTKRYAAAMDVKVRDEIASKGFSRSQIVILDALLKLRQVCCDPRLVKAGSAARKVRSAKLDLLMAMLPELVDEGRRILVFSQFTSMLALIEHELAASRHRLRAADRRHRDRETPIRRFPGWRGADLPDQPPGRRVGLNLTAADTVIHYDPWWNPAVENQATDRAHRLGQDKPVFVPEADRQRQHRGEDSRAAGTKAELAAGILSEDRMSIQVRQRRSRGAVRAMPN